jgi:hypothetical protein|tara:strand:- start:16 stop:741 length:726 start_codon:yes stop_codon:yes gene_type:complete
MRKAHKEITMTKVNTKVKAAAFEPVRTEHDVIGTIEMTQGLSDFLQAQVDRISQDATNELGKICNWARITKYQEEPSFTQFFGDLDQNAFDSAHMSNFNPRMRNSYCAQTVANGFSKFVKPKPNGAVWAAMDASGTISTVHSDEDPDAIELADLNYEKTDEFSAKYVQHTVDLKMLHDAFGLVPTTSRTERFELYLADKKAREQYGKDQQARANDKYRDKTESLAYIASVGKIAQATAHLV